MLIKYLIYKYRMCKCDKKEPSIEKPRPKVNPKKIEQSLIKNDPMYLVFGKGYLEHKLKNKD
tara:strand:- start:223 stop:408 length:186 start_codon:yes stop_codon:yes gene_type:complete